MSLRGNYSSTREAFLGMRYYSDHINPPPKPGEIFLLRRNEMAQVGAGAAAATEAQQSAKSIAQEIWEQGGRLQNIVFNIENSLCSAGVREHKPEPEKAMDTPVPSDIRWILNDANTRVRVATNLLDELAAVLSSEFA